MALRSYPAGTTTLRNLTPTYNYFLVVKPSDVDNDIPEVEYFVYHFIVSISSKDGINSLTNYFSGVNLITCQEISDTEYATGNFQHPHYLNQKNTPLTFKFKEIPIYFQAKQRVIDFTTDKFQYGSVPIIKDNTAHILEYSQPQRVNGKLI